MSRSRPRSHLVAYSSYYVLALIALAFFSFPTAWMVMSSLKAEADVAVYPPIWLFAPSLESFRHLFEEMNAWDAFLNSALIV
ncbi:MAG TPA: carbohydrate ABC transporter permease, partial [Alphaproteobacteria bacterium]|nr:carbohydrate ABC transporter permease [Alphaproteobacteria bacterium]